MHVLLFKRANPLIRLSNSLGASGRTTKVTDDYKLTDKDESAGSSLRDEHHASSVTVIQEVCLLILTTRHQLPTFHKQCFS